MTALEKAPPTAGMTQREEFGANEIAVSGEKGTTALAAAATAEVQARYIMAMRHPRDFDVVRQRVLKACTRSRFAEAALYAIKRGKTVTGFTVRFAEEVFRCMGNLYVSATLTYEDAKVRVFHVAVTDLETNAVRAGDVSVERTVERANPEGRIVLSSRPNSEGKPTYLVVATDDEMFAKQNSAISKARRNFILELCPADLKDEAREIIDATRRRPPQDPDAERKRLIDSFSQVGVKAHDLKLYVGHDLDVLTPAEWGDLRTLYANVRDGELTFKEALEVKQGATVEAKPVEGTASAQGAPAAPDPLAAKLAAKAAASTKSEPADRLATDPERAAWKALVGQHRGITASPVEVMDEMLGHVGLKDLGAATALEISAATKELERQAAEKAKGSNGKK